MTRRVFVVVWGVCALGCAEESFVPRWRVERLRVLAVVAEPPDARPGDTIALTVHTAQPEANPNVPRVLWATCPRLFIDNATGARRCEGEAMVQEGTTVRFRLGAVSEGSASWPFVGIACHGSPRIDRNMARLDCDGGEGEHFLRTVRVRTETPNGNPRIARISLGDTTLTPERPTPVQAGVTATLQVAFAPDAREPFTEVQPDGTVRTLREALLTQYLTDRGTFEASFRSDDDTMEPHRIRFAAPTRGTARIWVVLSDGRGGFDVATRTVVVP